VCIRAGGEGWVGGGGGGGGGWGGGGGGGGGLEVLWEKPVEVPTSSNINPTFSGLGLNPSLRDGRSHVNRVRLFTARELLNRCT